MSKLLYILVHVPKTAGGTLIAHIKKNFSEDENLSINDGNNKQHFADQQYVRNYLQGLPKTTKNKIKVISGHDVFYGFHNYFPNRITRYILFVRNPLQRAVSHYNYCRGIRRFSKEENPFNYRFWSNLFEQDQLLPFCNWFERNGEYQNFMTKFLVKRGFFEQTDFNRITAIDLNAALSKFFFIGTTESSTDYLYFYHLLGISDFQEDKNISQKFFSLKGLNDPTIQYFNELNKLDNLLYVRCFLKNELFKSCSKDFHQIIDHVAMLRRSSLLRGKIKRFFSRINYPLRLIRKIRRTRRNE